MYNSYLVFSTAVKNDHSEKNVGEILLKDGLLIIMAKNYRSEGDLVTQQPNSVIFSLSTGNMGTGGDMPGGEVNGNYKLENVGSGDMYRFKTSSLKAGSHVSFADSEDLIKTYSEMDLNDDPSVSGLRLGRSISWSAIERTNQNHDGSDENVFYRGELGNSTSDCYSLGSAERLSTSPIEEEAPEVIDQCESCDQVGKDDCEGSEQKHTDDKYSQENSSHVMSPHRTTGKPPLPNGKSKLRPSSGKQTSWLLRLFESKMFDMSIAISYLYNSKEPGVQTYLGKCVLISSILLEPFSGCHSSEYNCLTYVVLNIKRRMVFFIMYVLWHNKAFH